MEEAGRSGEVNNTDYQNDLCIFNRVCLEYSKHAADEERHSSIGCRVRIPCKDGRWDTCDLYKGFLSKKDQLTHH